MLKTLRISFSLKNTYRVNSILYALKQIPLLKRCLPDALYQSQKLKAFANGLSLLWELLSIFLGKFLYFLIMVAGPVWLYATDQSSQCFLHILLLLTVIGAFSNTFMFNPSKDKYYAMILLGMNCREYALIHYFYALIKAWIGFLAFGLAFGWLMGLTVVQCLLIPAGVVGMKMTMTGWNLQNYIRTGKIDSENQLSKGAWIALALLLAAAYGLPAINVMIPEAISAALLGVSAVAGLAALPGILRFQHYQEAYKALLFQGMVQMDSAKQAAAVQGQRSISADTHIVSHRKGFEYLNELFIRRHQKILWRSAKRIAAVSLAVIGAMLLIFILRPEFKARINSLLMTYLPYFVFVMYALNRGSGFTRALFVNCDHSLLTYSFYKQPRCILKLFQIRLREIIKVNLLPAGVIGAGLSLLLYASGGTDTPVNYGVLLISILSLSVFFSVHYLTIYYLLQPYNAATQVKSGTYSVVTWATYFVCVYFMNLKLPTLIFGLSTIAFCLLYCAVASLLVYRLAPKTFRLRL